MGLAVLPLLVAGADLAKSSSRGCFCTLLQVHGHDFSCVACLPALPGTSPTYTSGSEEKVIRVLEAPRAFLSTLALSRGEVPEEATSAVQVCRPLVKRPW